MIYEESSRQVKIIDKKIDQFANYLQRKNNLDRIQFLKGCLWVSADFPHIYLHPFNSHKLFSS